MDFDACEREQQIHMILVVASNKQYPFPHKTEAMEAWSDEQLRMNVAMLLSLPDPVVAAKGGGA